MARGSDSSIGFGLASPNDRPASPGANTRAAFYYTDTGVFAVWDGSTWTTIATLASGTLTDPVTFAHGGHGQTSQTAGFDALAPTTTAGDLIVYNGTDNIRLAVASNDYSTIISNSSVTAKLEWRDRGFGDTIFASSQATTSYYDWQPGNAAYSSFGGTNQINLHKMSFKPYREGRIYVRGMLGSLLTGNITVKIVDVTNSHDITPTVNFTSAGTWASKTSAWTSLHSDTYGGDAEYEAQGLSDDDNAKELRVGTIRLELR